MQRTQTVLANLPCGSGGLNSNFNSFRVPITDLVRASNIRFDNLALNKSPGISQLGSALSGAPSCRGGTAFFASNGVERSVTAWSDGHLYKEVSDVFDSVDLGSFGTITDPVSFVAFTNLAESGSPVSNRLAAFSRNCVPKYLNGDGSSLTSFTNVSADWSGNGPAGGFYHDYRLVAFAPDNYPHNIYFSALTDVTDFTGAGSKVMSVFPGEGDKIVAGASYLDTAAVLFKYPVGIYLVDTTDLTAPVNPVYRISNKIGGAGPLALTKVNDDIWFVTDQGRVYSLTQLRGDIDPRTADITRMLNLTEFIKRNVDLTRVKYSVLHFDNLRQEIWYCYTSKGGTSINDSALIFKLGEANSPIMVSVDSRGEFYNALWSRRSGDSSEQELLCAGRDGIVAEANNPNRNVLGEAFNASFSHPDTDFSYIDGSLAFKEKCFKFLKIQIIPTAETAEISIDIIVDGVYRRTETITLGSSIASTYGSGVYGTATYAGTSYVPHCIPLDVTGTRLQLIWYNNTVDEHFIIADAVVEMTVLGDTYEDK